MTLAVSFLLMVLSNNANVTKNRGSYGNTKFFFLHIPKVSGTSFLHNMYGLGNASYWSYSHGYGLQSGDHKSGGSRNVNVEDRLRADIISNEISFNMLSTLDERYVRDRKLAVLLRSPFSHVSSQFYHCKEATVMQFTKEYLKPKTKHPRYPRICCLGFNLILLEKQRKKASDVKQVADQIHSFHCYNPWNMMMRYTGMLKHFEFVGLAERHFESVCMLSFMIKGYLQPACNCTKGSRTLEFASQNTSKVLKLSHGVHHKLASNEEKEAMVPLVAKDLVLYEEGKERFEGELEHLEQHIGGPICSKPHSL
eukprot:m.134825 g.134825  ORF g.134825 m.134825 type:complete len:310 (-) comp14701_c0_seq2:39-968(-)